MSLSSVVRTSSLFQFSLRSILNSPDTWDTKAFHLGSGSPQRESLRAQRESLRARRESFSSSPRQESFQAQWSLDTSSGGTPACSPLSVCVCICICICIQMNHHDELAKRTSSQTLNIQMPKLSLRTTTTEVT